MLFKKEEIKREKFYLRIYFNLGKTGYSEQEKEALILHIQSFAKEHFSMFKYKYDIQGSGYGISKGSPYLGEKAFRNRFLKVGYAKTHGISIINHDSHFKVDLSIIDWDYWPGIHHLECHISLPLGHIPSSELMSLFLKSMNEMAKIGYGYGFEAPFKMCDIMEHYRRRVWLTTRIHPTFPFKDTLRWQKNLELIPKGHIRKLCEYNVLNRAQQGLFKGLNPDTAYPINDDIELWYINPDRLDNLNETWKEFIFDEQPHAPIELKRPNLS